MTDQPMTPHPPTDVVAGRFALCDPIGSGGSGTVWRAWDRTARRYCAAKLLRRRDAGQLLRFVREQAVRLDGAHVASPYAWAAEEADVLIAAELLDGGSLHTLIGDWGPLSEGTVAVILDQLLDALSAVHAAGWVHRDVKTSNVLCHATGFGPLHIELTDFGLAITDRDARFTELGTVIGTPGYLAPELLAGTGDLSVAQDLFAAGRVASALVSGAEPRVGDWAVPAVSDPVLRQVISALLASDPSGRPVSAAAARSMLTGAQEDATPTTAAGEPVEVLEQLPPLPAGWDPVDGPAVGSTPARQASVMEGPERTVVDPSGATEVLAEVVVPQAVVPPGSSVDRQRPTGDSPGPGRSAPSRRRWVGLIALAAVVGVATTIAVSASRGGGEGQSPSSTTSPSSTPVGSPSSAGTSSESSTGAGDSVLVVLGSVCGWQEEGDPAVDAAGTQLECRKTGDGYQWQPPPG